jgi:hypothetical protein
MLTEVNQMPTVGAKVSEKELQAIVEYANQCGETVSNLIRKVMISEATMLDGGWPNERPEYQHSWPIPEHISSEEEDRTVEEYVNKIRRILGWRAIRLTT